MNTPLLLDYCPTYLREDLDLNDGFDPLNYDDIAEDPDRSLIHGLACEARKHGRTRSEQALCNIRDAAWTLEFSLYQLAYVNDPEDRRQARAVLRELIVEIGRGLKRRRCSR